MNKRFLYATVCLVTAALFISVFSCDNGKTEKTSKPSQEKKVAEQNSQTEVSPTAKVGTSKPKQKTEEKGEKLAKKPKPDEGKPKPDEVKPKPDEGKPKLTSGKVLRFRRDTVTIPYDVSGVYKQELSETVEADDAGEITYAFKDEVAGFRIDRGTGEVRFDNAGDVTVTATKAATPGKYKESTVEYRLIVEVVDGTTLRNFSDKTPAREFSYSKSSVSYTQTVEKDTDVDDDDGAITYASKNAEVATVNPDTGEVTFVGAGDVTITATKAATTPKKYKESTVEYTLTVNKHVAADRDALGTEIQAAMKAKGNEVNLNYIDTSEVKNMEYLFTYKPSRSNPERRGFEGLQEFNGDISEWDVSKVVRMEGTFQNNSKFNGDISNWNVENVTIMGYMFDGATAFNQDISSWDAGNVEQIYAMFRGATAFNNGGKPLTWTIGNSKRPIRSSEKMFDGATAFNQDISSWDVSKVTTMKHMFEGATAFNNGGNPLTWTIKAVRSFERMFKDATAFNQDISSWNIENLIKKIRAANMKFMFHNATSFNNGGKPLTWKLDHIDRTRMFTGSGISDENLPELCKTHPKKCK